MTTLTISLLIVLYVVSKQYMILPDSRLSNYSTVILYAHFYYQKLMHLGGEGGVRRGIGQDFDIFQKIAVKFPTPRQKCEVNDLWSRARTKIQISLPPGQQDNSNALPLGQSDRSRSRPMPQSSLVRLI